MDIRGSAPLCVSRQKNMTFSSSSNYGAIVVESRLKRIVKLNATII